jgi:hypothetical protein
MKAALTFHFKIKLYIHNGIYILSHYLKLSNNIFWTHFIPINVPYFKWLPIYLFFFFFFINKTHKICYINNVKNIITF